MISILVFNIAEDSIISIYERWVWHIDNVNTSPFDFLVSGRTRRLTKAFSVFFSNIKYILFGWGLGLSEYYVNVEMDFLDLLYGIGSIGFLLITYLYLYFLIKNWRKTYWNKKTIFLIMVLIFFAGHVLFCGQSGMALGVMVLYMSVNNEKTS